MKQIFAFIALAAVAVTACKNDDESTWDTYAEWRESNEAWLVEQSQLTNPDGSKLYNAVSPSWNPAGTVLMRFCNDRSETEGNLSPIFTSTIDVRYTLTLCTGDTVDSSVGKTAGGLADVFRTRLDGVIQGWAATVPLMRCGDSIEILVPYQMGYNASSMGKIKPYSALKFGIRLVDIPFYETTPN